MDRVQFTFVVLYIISLSKYVSGEAVAYFPPDGTNQFQIFNPFFQPAIRNSMALEYMTPQRYSLPTEQVIQESILPRDHVTPILHKSAAKVIPPSVPESPMQGLNYTVDEGQSEENFLRASKNGFDYPTHPAASYPSAPSFPYTAPSAGYKPPVSPLSYKPASPVSYSPPAAPTSYSPASPSYVPAPAKPDKFPILKPDLTSLLKPVTTKVATKVSGLIGLVLSLLTGSAPDDLEMKGFKDIVINGIVKPLLIAKGGIKSLISKLTIPVISLLLINLEVLITVWWLWEECPESAKPTYTQPAYTKPSYTQPAYDTPSYNSYR